ncbi:FAEL040Wp [Eremothecium gossypii FDAG1]|nr:FAEL040Wp [Eremothecium gossypii FDAG1]
MCAHSARLRVLVADFDETITVRDTLALLATLGRRGAPPFDAFARAYAAAPAPVRGPAPSLLQRELQFQRAVAAREQASLRALEACGYFRGVPVARVHQLPGRALARPGFYAACALFAATHVLSLGWSREYIARVSRVPPAQIRCNALERAGARYTGRFTRGVVTGYDKYVILGHLVAAVGGADVWYVGDSESDLPCVLRPDVTGVLIYTSDAQLQRLAALLGARAPSGAWRHVQLLHGVWCVRDWGALAALVQQSDRSTTTV